MLRGCLEWQRGGMREPVSVTEATNEYRTESDPLTNFLGDACVVGEHCSVAANVAYVAYTDWASKQGMRKDDLLSGTAFGKEMVKRFERVKGRLSNVYLGVGLLSQHQEALSVEGFESDVEGYEDFSHNAESLSPRVGYLKNPPQPSTPSTEAWEVNV
jgi:phage/plasmid-associated DNA primase